MHFKGCSDEERIICFSQINENIMLPSLPHHLMNAKCNYICMHILIVINFV